jgi:hypothetical protein
VTRYCRKDLVFFFEMSCTLTRCTCSYKDRVIWRLGEAIHDLTLDAQWDFSVNGGRYMNGPRMAAANDIGVQIFGDAGFRILNSHRMTVTRREMAHPDGNHYWREGTTEEGLQLRIGWWHQS